MENLTLTWTTNTKDFVPAGSYVMTFKGVSKTKEPHPEFGDGLAWDFEIANGQYKGRIVSRVSGLSPTPKNRCGKMLMGVLGKTPGEGEAVDPAQYIGKHYTGIMVAGEKGAAKLEVIIPYVSPGF